jgi:hypothetical protein
MIQSYIKKYYGKDISLGCIENYARKGFYVVREKARLYRIKNREKTKKDRIVNSRKINPSYYEFEEFYRNFKQGECVGKIDSDNDYVAVLTVVEELQPTGARSKRIAERVGLENVKRQLKALSEKKLIKHETGSTFTPTEDGRNLLKILKLSD